MAEEKYIDTLPYEDIDQLAIALNESTLVDIRLDKLSKIQQLAIEITDEIIKEAPTPDKTLTIYKQFKGAEQLRNGGELKEPAFFTGTTKKPSEIRGVITLEVEVPSNMKVLEFPDGAYALERGLTFDLEPTKEGPIPAKIKKREPKSQIALTICKDCGESARNHEELKNLSPEEFFNKCHDASGRFCSSGGGGGETKKKVEAKAPSIILSGPKDSSNKVGDWPKFGQEVSVKKIAEAPEGKTLGIFEKRVSVDGLKVKSAYEITTKRGSKLKVYDLDGKEFGGLHKDISSAVADMHDIYPMKPPRSVVMVNRSAFNGAFAWIYPDKPHIFVNQKDINELETNKRVKKSVEKDWFMPSFNVSNKKDRTQYLMYHEYGHQYDFNNGIRSWKQAQNLWKNKENRKQLSPYGQYLMVEGYAEAFAEWHFTQGKTKNTAAINYAKHEGWHGSGTKAVKASGEPFFTVQLWSFANEVVDTPIDADLKDLLPFDPEEGIIIIDRLGEKPELRGAKEPKVEASTETIFFEANSISLKTCIFENGKCINCGIPQDTFNITSTIDLNSEEIQEFFNKCHDASGRFCSGAGARGRLAAKPLEEGGIKVGGDGDGFPSSTDSRGTVIDGVRGFDPKGKPIPGTDAWIEAHGMDRKTFDGRPYVRFEKGPNEPAIAREYGDFPKDHRLFNKVSNQTSGYIMKRNPVPGSPYGKILGEVRPDTRVVLDPGNYARRQTILNNDKKRLADLKKFSHEDLVKDRQSRLKTAEDNLSKIKKTTPDTIKKDAADRLDRAGKDLKKAKDSGDIGRIKEAQVEFDRAKRSNVKAQRIARNWRPEKEIYDAETAVTTAKKRLERAETDPARALSHDISAAQRRVNRSQNRLDKAAIKYTFPSQPGAASRLDVHPDAQNVKNLTTGKGRVYWSMEGNIKSDAVLTALKKEDPTASVISNPSVTLWQNPETQWVTKKHLQGREVVLLPDADGVKNPNVVAQAKGLQAALQNAGAGRVIIASPPLKGGKIETITLRSGAKDERKGIDDHLGAGKGTLGQLTYTQQTLPKISLREYTKEGGAGGLKINRNALKGTEQTLTAVSSIVGEKGVGKVPKNMISQASGLPPTSALDARRRLERLGIIKVEYVFDPDALSRGKKVQIMSDERIAQLVRQKVIKQPRTDEPFSSIDFDESPVITILNKKYLAKETAPKPLSSIDTWKPPKNFKGWTSPVTGQPAELKVAPKGSIVIRTQAGAKRFGKGVGQIVKFETEDSTLLSMEFNKEEYG